MANKTIFDFKEQIDFENKKLDAIIQLKTWQKQMFLAIDHVYTKRLNEIKELNSEIIIDQNIPENFQDLLERTIRLNHEDDDFIMINIDKKDEEIPPTKTSESRVSKILHSEPVQQALTVTLAQTLTHMGTAAATSATTIAAAVMAKTVLSTTAYALGTIAIGTTKKVWSFLL